MKISPIDKEKIKRNINLAIAALNETKDDIKILDNELREAYTKAFLATYDLFILWHMKQESGEL